MIGIPKRIQEKRNRLRQFFTDTQALVKLEALQLGYVPWTTYALKPTVMVQIVNEMVINDRRSIVEFGAGISTLHLAKVAQQRPTGIKTVITSIEDDPAWAELVRGGLRDRGLEDYANIIVAPLKPCSFSVANLEWYDEKFVAEALEGQKQIDLVIVDGPKACESGKSLSRFPAFHAVSSSLGARCAVVLDDISRPGEQEILELWRKHPDFDLEVKKTDLCAVCYRGENFTAL